MWWSIYFDWVIRLVIVIAQFLTLRTMGMDVSQRAQKDTKTQKKLAVHLKVSVSRHRDLLEIFWISSSYQGESKQEATNKQKPFFFF